MCIKKKKYGSSHSDREKGRPGPGLSPLERPDWSRPSCVELCCRVDGASEADGLSERASVAVDAELPQQSCQGGFTALSLTAAFIISFFFFFLFTLLSRVLQPN